ncbi:MAG: hypothetical protein RLZZ204_403 [Bacteroidota bacterium]|jgi:hypothetical protein
MQDFIFYFLIGWKHILSWDATDHIYFITALAIIYSFQDWKKVLVLVTAFTIGHALTLYLSALDIFRFSVEWVEFAIPCSIVITAASNLLIKEEKKTKGKLQYLLALGFGLVHGMGYANYIRMMLSRNQNLVPSLFSFNVGLEMGQILLVVLVLSSKWLLGKYNLVSTRILVTGVSIYISIVSLILAVERFQGLSF